MSKTTKAIAFVAWVIIPGGTIVVPAAVLFWRRLTKTTDENSGGSRPDSEIHAIHVDWIQPAE